MKLGFIGIGKIASSVIEGICNSEIPYKKILISARNRKISQNLKKKFKKIIIVQDNQ
jgi:pyrroline-5-carboxylate reductase